MVFLDVSKAFDKVWHKGLIFKLQKMGIRGNLLKWLKDYISGRHQKVVLNGVESKVCYLEAGVPQGSILGPLLFLIYILREKSLAIYFEDSQIRRNRTFNFILSNIYVDKRSQIR